MIRPTPPDKKQPPPSLKARHHRPGGFRGRHAAEISDLKSKVRQESAARRKTETKLKRSERFHAASLKESARLQEQLRRLSHQILFAQEEERKRISRELHDEVTGTLTGIKLELNALEAKAAGNQDVKEKIARTQQRVQEAVETIHRFARELRPATLDDLGLIPALHSFCKALSKETGLQIQLSAFRAVEELDDARKTALYRITQEALGNVAKHAQAAKVSVTLSHQGAEVRLSIEDDGKGFQPARHLGTKTPRRLGLLGMRERAEMVGGSFTVTSAPGSGTSIVTVIPSGRVRPKNADEAMPRGNGQ